jgi:transposase, IS30 family
MSYHQLTSEERYALSLLRKQGLSQRLIARTLGRHPSTISRELRRNVRQKTWYRAKDADDIARTRRRASRRYRRLSEPDWALICRMLQKRWSPEQIVGRLRRKGVVVVSHETIYRYVWADRRRGGTLYKYLRCSLKLRRKRKGSYDSRGRLAGKRPISERPPGAENRSRIGHLEGDTMIGSSDQHCVITLVDRKTGYVSIGKLKKRTVEEANRKAIELLRRGPRRTRTLTLDNGTEFHGYKAIEAATGARVYFATPHHAWERGTNENTNGLIRQYLPKRQSMGGVDQRACDWIARELNDRPRKRLGFRTPAECYEKL